MFGSILAGALGGKSQAGGAINTGVLQISGGGALTSVLQNVTDQSGNISPLQLSTLNVQINSPAGAGNERRLIINTADSASAKIFSFRTNNLQRWALRVDTAESGANAGSNFFIRRYDDAGNFVQSAFSINRANGSIDITPGAATFSAGTNTINQLNLAYTINTTGGTNTIAGVNINVTNTSLTGTVSFPFRIQRSGVNSLSVQQTAAGAFMAINRDPSVFYDFMTTGQILCGSNLVISGSGLFMGTNGIDWGNSNFALTTGTGILTITSQRIRLSGTTSAFPALKRNGTTVEIRLADDSAYGNIDALRYFTSGVQGVSGSFISSDAKTITVTNGIVTAIV